MINSIYRVLHRSMSKSQHRGEYSGGRWQEEVRSRALKMGSCCSGKVLEAGCGEGLFLRDAVSVYPQTEWWGGDNHHERLIRARQGIGRLRGGSRTAPATRVLRFDACCLPFHDGVFDAVFCLNVFFNMPSLDVVSGALAEMSRVCRRGGRVIFDYRSAHNIFLLLKYKSARVYDPTVRALPLNVYRHEDIRALLKKNNLIMGRTDTVAFPFGCPAIIIIEAQKP